jgi:tryptophan synthase beta chain
MQYPDQNGFFGEFGGRFVPPALESALRELETAFCRYRDDPDFQSELEYYLRQYRCAPLQP